MNIKPLTLGSIDKNRQKTEQRVEKFVRHKLPFPKQALHLHACRGGPLLANEIYLSINEKASNRNLEKIIGLLHPFNPTVKFFLYWFGGLEEKILNNALKRISFHEGKMVTENKFNEKILFSIAQNIHLDWKSGLEFFFLPVLEAYGNEYLNILGSNMKKLIPNLEKSLKKKSIWSLEDFLLFLSLFLVNKILSLRNFPTFEIKKINSHSSKTLENKALNVKKWKGKRKKLLNKEKIRFRHSMDTFKKRIRGYNREINLVDIDYLYRILRNKKNGAVRFLGFSTKEIHGLIKEDNPAEKHKPSLIQELLLAANTYSTSIDSKGNGYPFISGEKMIEFCFQFANENKIPLVLQNFFRPGGYEKYKEMLEKFPTVSTYSSSVDIWRVDLFPEYDNNLFKAVPYLLNQTPLR